MQFKCDQSTQIEKKLTAYWNFHVGYFFNISRLHNILSDSSSYSWQSLIHLLWNKVMKINYLAFFIATFMLHLPNRSYNELYWEERDQKSIYSCSASTVVNLMTCLLFWLYFQFLWEKYSIFHILFLCYVFFWKRINLIENELFRPMSCDHKIEITTNLTSIVTEI